MLNALKVLLLFYNLLEKKLINRSELFTRILWRFLHEALVFKLVIPNSLPTFFKDYQFLLCVKI